MHILNIQENYRRAMKWLSTILVECDVSIIMAYCIQVKFGSVLNLTVWQSVLEPLIMMSANNIIISIASKGVGLAPNVSTRKIKTTRLAS